jgi:pimeloyl-ACP methyl ester carboxylesterase
VPVAQAHLFKQKVPAAQLVLIENCGHFPMYENFEAFIQPVKEFLQIA